MDRIKLRPFIKSIYNVSGKIHHIRNMDIPLKMGIKVNTAALSTLDVINRYPELKMSEIGNAMGITKGAISQMARKLEQLELIDKHKSQNNAKDTYLVVTDKGRQALDEYYGLHDKLYNGLFEILNQYSNHDVEIIKQFLLQTDQLLVSLKGEIKYD